LGFGYRVLPYVKPAKAFFLKHPKLLKDHSLVKHLLILIKIKSINIEICKTLDESYPKPLCAATKFDKYQAMSIFKYLLIYLYASALNLFIDQIDI